MRRSLSQELEPDPRARNGHTLNKENKRSYKESLLSGINTINKRDSGHGDCHCQHKTPPPPDEPPLQLYGARTAPSALLKVQAEIQTNSGAVSVQPMIDSGASGMGFMDPSLVQRVGATLKPSSRRITLADGSEVRAAGEVTLNYSLDAKSCRGKDSTPAVHFTSTFIVTPLAPHEMILGLGWLETHRVLVGFRERSIQLQVNGAGKQLCIRPLTRCNDDGKPVEQAAPLQLKSITQKRVRKLMRQKQIEQLYAVLIRPTEDSAAKSEVTVVPGSELPRVKMLLDEFKDTVFAEPKPGVPRKRGVEHAIQLLPGSSPPPARPLRHQSEKDAEVMREYVEAGLKAGTLQPSVSPYGSMALIVKKKDGSPRVVIDFRALNEVTIKNKYPLPLMDELFDRTYGARFFTSIDLRNGFHQIAIQKQDREKTAFRTRFGHFEYTVLPMGLCNAPGTFMQLMNQVFADMLDKSVLCFLDDILIFSRTEEEHLQHLRTVLTRLREQELYVKMSKCAFMQREVSFLGHRIGADGLRVAPDKISAVQQWPKPMNVTEVRSFLGLANFYRRFIRHFSHSAMPLTELTKESTPWKWGEEQQRAFVELKAALCSPPVLLVPDQSKPFVLNCDACKYAIGGTLQQDQGQGLQPVAYFSAKMSDAERNYDVREKEFMALLKACLHWRHYLHGMHPFTLLSDHDSLKYHKSMPNLSGRLARWIEKMAEFDYVLKHIPGKDNIPADALSRRADYAQQALMLGAVRQRPPPEPASQRQRNIDAAMKVLPRAADLPRPNKHGTIMTPTQRCSANTKAGDQCAQRTAVAHVCWNHLLRDLGVRVKPSAVPGAGRGLFAGKREGLPKGHRINYTGDIIELDDNNNIGGPYVLQTKSGSGIDAARRNCGLGRWVNDPRGAKDAQGRPCRPNCEFVLFTPPGGRQRVAAVRTLRPVLSGEELLVQYGQKYWRFHAAGSKRVPRPRAAARSTVSVPAVTAPAAAANRSNRDRHFEAVLVTTLASLENSDNSNRQLRHTADRQRARAEAAQRVQQPQQQSSARAGSAATPPVAQHQEEEHKEPSASFTSEARSAAARDVDYQRQLQASPAGLHGNRGLLFDERGRMRVPADTRLRTRIMAELHDSTTGAHCGRDRMLAAAQRRFTWDGLTTDIERYVNTCDTCQRNKHSKQLTPGLLMPLPLPEEPCMYWTTDAVCGLPKTKRGFDAIQVYVDRLTKLKRFAVAHTSDGSTQLADTTLRTIIGPHGMPKGIVSDRDPRITAKFWRELSRLLGSEVNLSTAHHPQADGQSEREIQTLTTALRSYVNAMGDDWDEFLPALELAFNSKVQASTGAAPFTLVYGVEPRLPIDCVLDDARPATVPAAEQRAERMKKALNQARCKAEQAQAKQKQQADRHRRLLQLKEGDQVLLSTEHLQLRSGSHKLTARYIGPFRVIGMVNDNAAQLELPPLLGALHSTFNISRLKLYRDGRNLFPDRPQRLEQPPAVETDTNGAAQYEVDYVVAQRGKGSRSELLIRWKGYGAEHDQWQRRSELVKTAPTKVADFEALQPGSLLNALAHNLTSSLLDAAAHQQPPPPSVIIRAMVQGLVGNASGHCTLEDQGKAERGGCDRAQQLSTIWE